MKTGFLWGGGRKLNTMIKLRIAGTYTKHSLYVLYIKLIWLTRSLFLVTIFLDYF